MTGDLLPDHVPPADPRRGGLRSTVDVELVGTVEEAIERMEGLAEALHPGDGFAHFNRMYLTVTKMVQGALGAQQFQHPNFLTALDVEFANRYLGALAAAQQARTQDMPRCWRVLHDHRWNPHILGIQFAVAGMNAHINHDLVLALLRVWQGTGQPPTVFHDDFTRVNLLLGGLENDIRRSFESQRALRVDQRLAAPEHAVDMWSITTARALAWNNARLLWRLRSRADATRRAERLLDDAVTSASECLLLPAEPARATPAQ